MNNPSPISLLNVKDASMAHWALLWAHLHNFLSPLDRRDPASFSDAGSVPPRALNDRCAARGCTVIVSADDSVSSASLPARRATIWGASRDDSLNYMGALKHAGVEVLARDYQSDEDTGRSEGCGVFGAPDHTLCVETWASDFDGEMGTAVTLTLAFGTPWQRQIYEAGWIASVNGSILRRLERLEDCPAKQRRELALALRDFVDTRLAA